MILLAALRTSYVTVTFYHDSYIYMVLDWHVLTLKLETSNWNGNFEKKTCNIWTNHVPLGILVYSRVISQAIRKNQGVEMMYPPAGTANLREVTRKFRGGMQTKFVKLRLLVFLQTIPPFARPVSF